MKVLFDHNVPRKLRWLLPRHDVSSSRELGWDLLKNGELLDIAEENDFKVLVTGDKNLTYQQNLKDRQISILVLATTDWNILKNDPEPVIIALDKIKPGHVLRLEGKGATRL